MAAHPTMSAEDVARRPPSVADRHKPRAAPALLHYGWSIWYGLATRRWWAMAPAWYGHVSGLIEADDPDKLSDLIRQAERSRPRFDGADRGATRQIRATVARNGQKPTSPAVRSAADRRWA